jgi:uncharacterized NAD-dependent epimerase/dehydratase family protein
MEAMAALARPVDAPQPPARVVAVALNTAHLDAAAAARAMAETTALTGLPCHDPVREGGDGLLAAISRPSQPERH